MKRAMMFSVVMMLMMGLSFAFAQEDPFAGLGGGGEEDGLAAPDGSSSIRAKRKATKETFQGMVIQVEKDEKSFPAITKIMVKVTKPPKCKKAPHSELKKGKVYEFTILYNMKDKVLDLADKDNQTNVGAWYLRKKDKVRAEIKEGKDGKYVLKYIERK